MLASILTSDNTGNSAGNLILAGEITVIVKIFDVITTRDGIENKIKKEDHRKYDLNNPYEYGAFIEDSASGYVEELAAGATTAWSELKDPTTTADRKRQILDSGKPYQYANTKRLAVVRPENNRFYLVNQAAPIIYAYDYDNSCEKIDFDSKVIPGTNKKNPNSPCNAIVIEPTGSTTNVPQIEIGLLSKTFIDFDDYKSGYKSLFQEIGYRTGSVGNFLPFNPKRFQFISESLIIDQLEDVISGPIRVTEEEIQERGIIKTDLVIFQEIQKRNKRTRAISSGSGVEVEVYRQTLNQISTDIFIYKKIENSNLKTTLMNNNTSGVWNGTGKLYNFYTSSFQTSLEKSYKLDVLSGSCEPSKMFTIYYGDDTGGGTSKISDDRKKYGYSKSIYSMFSSLVGNTLTKKIFFTDNSVSQSTYLLNQLNTLTDQNIGTFINSNFNLGYDPSGYGYVNFKDGLDVVYVSGSDVYYKPGLTGTGGPTLLTPTKKAEKIFAIQINPKLLKNSIDEGNFELVLAQVSASGAPDPNDPNVIPPIGGWGIRVTADPNSDKVIKLIDASRKYDIISEGDTQDSNRFKSGFIGQLAYDLVSGSLVDGIYASNNPIIYGKVYPGYGLIILDAEKLDPELNLNIISDLNSNGENPLRLFASISGSAYPTLVRNSVYPFNMRNVNAEIVDTFEIVLNSSDFNYSTNPSYYANRERSPFFRPAGQTNFANGRMDDGTLRFRQWFYDPITYITGIGLYNDTYELLAIGKLSKPIRKSFNTSLTLKVNIRY